MPPTRSLFLLAAFLDFIGVDADLRLASWPRTVQNPKTKNDETYTTETLRDSWLVIHQGRRRTLPFNSTYAHYYEPSDFGYEGLKKQRQKAYDNFLRSNIDNEQDRRNIETEDGKDHLPFRTWEGCKAGGKHCDVHASHETKMATKGNTAWGEHSIVLEYKQAISYRRYNQSKREEKVTYAQCLQRCKDDDKCQCIGYDPTSERRAGDGGTLCDQGHSCRGLHNNANAAGDDRVGADVRHHFPYIQVKQGEEKLVPLRWNNPHSAELEVNIWIMNTGQAIPIVVPIMKPSCSGEGYQDQAFTFKVPTNFNALGRHVAGFKGCKAVGDCVLQIYAHSVEPRMYAIGVPLVVEGTVTGQVNQNTNNVKKADHNDLKDPGVVGVEKLRKICLPRGDNSVHWGTAQPQQARLISDQWNWAYQNSDFSPYAGQQPKYISKNLQASVVIEMLPGNRGSLGIHALYRDNNMGFHKQRELLRKARKVKHEFEQLADALIQFLEKKDAHKNSDHMKNIKTELQATTEQYTEFCFRCNEVGSTGIKRQNHRTYIPSFQITDPQTLAAVKFLMGDEYKDLIDDEGYVQIYYTAMWSLMDEFRKVAEYNIHYQGAVIKETIDTKEDALNYKSIPKEGVRRDDQSAVTARLAYQAAKRYGEQMDRRGRKQYPENNWCQSRNASVPHYHKECAPNATLPAPAPPPKLASALAVTCAVNDPECASVQSGIRNTDQIAGFTAIGTDGDMHSLDEDRDCDDVTGVCTTEACDGANDKNASEMTCQPLSSVKHLFTYKDEALLYETAGTTDEVQGMVSVNAANSFSSLAVLGMLILGHFAC